MPVVPFQPMRAGGAQPKVRLDPTMVMAAVADLHKAGMLTEPEPEFNAPEPKVTNESDGRG